MMPRLEHVAFEAAAAAVDGSEEATYLDRALARAAVGLALVRADRADAGLARLADARVIVEATDDQVGAVVIALAEAIGAEAAGRGDAVAQHSAAAVALARLGLTATGWETAFRLAAGIGAPAPV